MCLKHDSFQGLVNLESLTLSSCNFGSYSSKSFEFTPNIKRLVYLDPIDFGHIDLRYLTKINTLVIKTNDFDFRNLAYLKDNVKNLVIKDNLDQSKLSRLIENIKHLSLDELALKLSKDVKYFDSDWLAELTGLKALQLKCNQQKLNVKLDLKAKLDSFKLKSCFLDSIVYSQNLEQLDMENAAFYQTNNRLSQKFLTGLSNLTKLDLRKNQLADIDLATFTQTLNLRQLCLAENKLRVICREIFEKLNKLEDLDLSNNMIEILQNRVFCDLVNLIRLDLSGNRISRLDERMFVGLENLMELYLKDNLILDQFESLDILAKITYLKRSD